MRPISTKVNDTLKKDDMELGHMAIIPFRVLCKCRNILKKQRRLRSLAQLIKESKESNTFDCFDCLSSSTGASIIPNIGLSVSRWKKNQIIKKL